MENDMENDNHHQQQQLFVPEMTTNHETTVNGNADDESFDIRRSVRELTSVVNTAVVAITVCSSFDILKVLKKSSNRCSC
jgi:hypothetical protein